MSHLKCVAHDRRSVVIPNGTVYHRTGDGSRCGHVLLRTKTGLMDAFAIALADPMPMPEKPNRWKHVAELMRQAADRFRESLGEFSEELYQTEFGQAERDQDDGYLDRNYTGAPDECSLCYLYGHIVKADDCVAHDNS